MTEYSLDDFLTDPITRQLMARDAVDEADIRSLADRVRKRPTRTQRPQEPRSFEV